MPIRSPKQLEACGRLLIFKTIILPANSIKTTTATTCYLHRLQKHIFAPPPKVGPIVPARGQRAASCPWRPLHSLRVPQPSPPYSGEAQVEGASGLPRSPTLQARGQMLLPPCQVPWGRAPELASHSPTRICGGPPGSWEHSRGWGEFSALLEVAMWGSDDKQATMDREGSQNPITRPPLTSFGAGLVCMSMCARVCGGHSHCEG